MRAMILTATAMGGLLLASPALAQDAPTASSESDSTPEAPRRGFEGEALDLDAAGGGTIIIGKEHLPDFTVLIDREDLSKAYDLELDERFLPKIIEAVGKAPF